MSAPAPNAGGGAPAAGAPGAAPNEKLGGEAADAPKLNPDEAAAAAFAISGPANGTQASPHFLRR